MDCKMDSKSEEYFALLETFRGHINMIEELLKLSTNPLLKERARNAINEQVIEDMEKHMDMCCDFSEKLMVLLPEGNKKSNGEVYRKNEKKDEKRKEERKEDTSPVPISTPVKRR